MNSYNCISMLLAISLFIIPGLSRVYIYIIRTGCPKKSLVLKIYSIGISQNRRLKLVRRCVVCSKVLVSIVGYEIGTPDSA